MKRILIAGALAAAWSAVACAGGPGGEWSTDLGKGDSPARAAGESYNDSRDSSGANRDLAPSAADSNACFPCTGVLVCDATVTVRTTVNGDTTETKRTQKIKIPLGSAGNGCGFDSRQYTQDAKDGIAIALTCGGQATVESDDGKVSGSWTLSGGKLTLCGTADGKTECITCEHDPGGKIDDQRQPDPPTDTTGGGTNQTDPANPPTG